MAKEEAKMREFKKQFEADVSSEIDLQPQNVVAEIIDLD